MAKSQKKKKSKVMTWIENNPKTVNFIGGLFAAVVTAGATQYVGGYSRKAGENRYVTTHRNNSK